MNPSCLLLVLSLFFVIALPAQAQKKKMTVQNWWENAEKKVESQNYKSAIIDINKGLALDSTHPHLYSLRSLCKGNIEDKKGEYEDLLLAAKYSRTKNDSVMYRFNLALSNHARKQYDKAVEYYREMLKIMPEYTGGYSAFIMELLYAKRFEEAEKEAKALLLMDSDVQTQFYLQRTLAYALLFQNRGSQAEEIFTKICRNIPEGVNIEETLQSDKKDFTEAGLQHHDLAKLYAVAKKQ